MTNFVSNAIRIAAIGTAVPDMKLTQLETAEVLMRYYGAGLKERSRSILQKVFQHPSILKRHHAFIRPEHLVNEDPDVRMERFTHYAINLSKEACLKALHNAKSSIEDVKGVVVNTCTGYICPGISTYLLEHLSLPFDTPAYDLVGAGCGGAIPNLEIAGSLLNTTQGSVLSVSVEICSATFQMSDDLSLIISNAIFGDGAAAALLWKHPTGLAIVDSERFYSPEHREDIRYVYKKGELHNQLSVHLPVVLQKVVPPVVTKLLERHHLKAKDIRHWAIHPGGDKVITAVQNGLGLSPEQIKVTRKILSEYGNMSSPTVWFEMERILSNGVESGEWCVMVGMGAGLSVHVILLRA